MPTPRSFATGPTLGDFICRSCRFRSRPALSAWSHSQLSPQCSRRPPPYHPPTRLYYSQEAISQQTPSYPRPHGRSPSNTSSSRPTQTATAEPETNKTKKSSRSKAWVRPEKAARHTRRGPSKAGPSLNNEAFDFSSMGDLGDMADMSELMSKMGEMDMDDMGDMGDMADMMGDDMPNINIFNETARGGVHKDKAAKVKKNMKNVQDELAFLDEFVKILRLKEAPDDENHSFRTDDHDPDDTTVGLPDPAKKGDKVYILLPALKIEISHWPISKRSPIALLNQMILRSASAIKGDSLESHHIATTWKRYSVVRQTLSTSWQHVPRPTWDILWTIFAATGIKNPNRMHHLYVLAKDIAAAGLELTNEQRLLAIEAMFTDNAQDEAVENWKRGLPTVGADPDYFVRYRELGVQMFCFLRDLERADAAAKQIMSSDYERNPRILIPLVEALVSNRDYRERAWEAYRQMRDGLGEEMTIEDYDMIIACFLHAGLPEYGLFAFVDMMTNRAVDLHGRETLPHSIANKFFFGKWLKRLIGSGDLDGAETVVQFMNERGVQPAPIQLNGLIGAWMRTAQPDYEKKAESMAWDMIMSRVDFVRARRFTQSQQLDGPLRLVEVEPTGLVVPRATSETFALLAEHYRTKVSFPKLAHLWMVLKHADIPVDGYLLGPLLESYQQKHLANEAFDLFFSVAHHNRLQLAWATFKPLWLCLGVTMSPHTHHDTEDKVADIKMARRLFAEMMKSSTSLMVDSAMAPEYMGHIILEAFRVLGDNLGFIIALRALVDRFNLLLTDTLALHMISGHWEPRKQMEMPVDEEGNRYGRSAAHMLAEFLSYRMFTTGRTIESLSPEDRAKELQLYLERVFGLKVPGLGKDREVDAVYDHVAMEMGVRKGTITVRAEKSKVVGAVSGPGPIVGGH